MTHPFCTVTASTKRNADLGNGIIGAPATYLATLAVTPLWPLQQATVVELALSSPREFKECYHVPAADTLPDVVEGDVLVHSGREYQIYFAGEWGDLGGGIPALLIVVQEVKGS